MLLFSDLITDNRDACLREGKLLPSHRYPNSVYVEHAVDYIAANFDKRLKINELADRIGVNRSYLTSSFKKRPRMLAAGISYESSHREGKDSSEKWRYSGQ